VNTDDSGAFLHDCAPMGLAFDGTRLAEGTTIQVWD
jgi:hypothetical protein